jgi:hypothetical protein
MKNSTRRYVFLLNKTHYNVKFLIFYYPKMLKDEHMLKHTLQLSEMQLMSLKMET